MSKEHYAAHSGGHRAVFALLPLGTSIFSGSFSSKSWAVLLRSSRMLLLTVGTISGYRIKLMWSPDSFLLSPWRDKFNHFGSIAAAALSSDLLNNSAEWQEDHICQALLYSLTFFNGQHFFSPCYYSLLKALLNLLTNKIHICTRSARIHNGCA